MVEFSTIFSVPSHGNQRGIGTQPKKHRRLQGLSQEELAHRAEIDRTYISSLERCVYAAGIDVVDQLARALGMEAADLLRKPDLPARKTKSK